MIRRETADLRVHPELDIEAQHLMEAVGFDELLVEALHEGGFEAVLLRFGRQDRGRKLERVADDDDVVGVKVDDRDEEVGLGALAGFVDEDASEGVDCIEQEGRSGRVQRREDHPRVADLPPSFLRSPLRLELPDGRFHRLFAADPNDSASQLFRHPGGVVDALQQLVDGCVRGRANENRIAELKFRKARVSQKPENRRDGVRFTGSCGSKCIG